MRIPLATYRLQFNSTFNFQAGRAIVPYLAELGISDLYASPISTATSGSQHGYDVVNPQEISPELGGEEQFEALVQALQGYHLGWLQDIVPNHMAFNGENPMLVDIFEKGASSEYWDYFDIDWNYCYQGIKNRVLAPFLGKLYGDCLEAGELQLRYDRNGFSINYGDLKLPLRISSYSQVLTYNLSQLESTLNSDHSGLVKLLELLNLLKDFTVSKADNCQDNVASIKLLLGELWQDSPEIQQFIAANIQKFNGNPEKPESFDLLDKLLQDQYFRLSYWKNSDEELNYRRFFNINSLICLRIENQDVFDTIHHRIFQLVNQGKVTGVRIDHIDGLYDPAQYLKRLREKLPEAYLVVEKILATDEVMPLNWQVQGTTGYDFLNRVNGIFCQQLSEAELEQVYHNFIGYSMSCEALVYENKQLIINNHLAGDIDNLAHLLKQIASCHRHASDFTFYGLRKALVEVLLRFPIYRTYIDQDGLNDSDRQCIQQVLSKAKQQIPDFLNELKFIEKFLLLEFDKHLTEQDKFEWLHFLMRLQQFTGPLMAKGIEDTVLYRYNRLISLNEVGSHPGQFGTTLADFHRFNQTHAANCPHTLNTTSTHDTKRGEDVRARINVLSEMPDEWASRVKLWHQINAAQRTSIQGADAPDLNDEYFFYQTLVGAFPFTSTDYSTFVDRIKDYLVKCIREAKVYTKRLEPDTEYETAFTQFAERVLQDTPGNTFLQDFRTFQQKIQSYGVYNSLSQTFLKLVSPGTPDIYQGSELWDLSLVDPDNRRPVDFAIREQYLREIKQQYETGIQDLLNELMENPEDGRIKLFLVYRLLYARQSYPTLFQSGDYQELKVMGKHQNHVIAFARTFGDQMAIAIAPRLLVPLINVGELPLGESVWDDTHILPMHSHPVTWQNIITGQVIQPQDNPLYLKEVLQQFPVALLVNQRSNH